MNVFLKRILKNFVFGNFFIALCATSMVFTTFLMNGLPLYLTPFTIFLTLATFLLYNFHFITFDLNYSGKKELMHSATAIKLSGFNKIIYSLCLLGLIVSIFFLHPRIFPYLIPLALIAVWYSIPLISLGKVKVRLRELSLLKTAALGAVWGLTTTIIPLVEQNISLESPFVLLQIISRSLFVFALCIPFELRDVEPDKAKNIYTFPVRYGSRLTKISGVIVILIEIITHHLMSSSLANLSIIALDLSSVMALVWIILANKNSGEYYHKLFVDGTMLFRFLFLLIAIKIK